MKRILGLTLCFLMCGAFVAFAEEQAAVTEPAVVAGVEQAETALSADKAQFQAQKAEIKKNAEAGRDEEKELRKQINAARESGDKEKANALREQLMKLHQENVDQRIADRKKMMESRKELRKDRKEVRKENRKEKKEKRGERRGKQ